MPYRILSCDGGGIRGLLTSLMIQRLDQKYQILSQIDLFAGTSTGGILSLGLASGLDAQAAVDLYRDDGPQIFTPFSPAQKVEMVERLRAVAPSAAGSVWDRLWAELLGDLNALFFVKYDNQALKALLQTKIKQTQLSQLRPVTVTTFQLDQGGKHWAPITISNLKNASGAATSPIDAALCTGAAPTYFPPYQHPVYGYCVDGGVYANNPCVMALADALRAGASLDDIEILSLGTGVSAQRMAVIPPPTNYGPLLWMFPLALPPTPALPLVSVLTDGVPEAASFQLRQLLGDGLKDPNARFARANVPLDQPIPLDGFQPKDIQAMEDAAKKYFATAEWRAVETWVRKQFVGGKG